MMEPIRDDDAEFLASLEERILRAVELVGQLRKENEALESKLESASEARRGLEADLDDARRENARLANELDSMQAERKQVRTRIEKLLGQMDLLSAS
ncbi:MAG: cell division protein ZapB [Bryobacterales bacterium]|nr:cell division protein ZapB [Bryobacterales bacterium]